MIDLILKNAEIPNGPVFETVDILVKAGKIVGFVQNNDLIATTIIDVSGKLVLPGCIDAHTHLDDPGFTAREDFYTGTCAAAAGGVTTIIDMPCSSLPAVRSAASLQNKRDAVQAKAMVDYAFWGGATGEDVRNGDLEVRMREQAAAGVVGFKVYMTPSLPSYPGVSEPEMVEVMRVAAALGLPVGVHAEHFPLCDFYSNKLKQQGRIDGPAWAEARCDRHGRKRMGASPISALEGGNE